MSRALELARRGMYTTHPNPRVGCVLVKDERIVGEGWHHQAGGPHAEVVALEKAGTNAAGASCYVTLEPCSHQGRTGPCCDTLVEAGVASVIAAMGDPNPSVAGQGIEKLGAAGIDTSLGLMKAQAEALNPGHIMRMTQGRPYIRCKMAMSLDGRTAMADGQSKWITGEAARADVQLLRAMSSAVMTGVDTVLADDPSLNVRGVDIGERESLRIVLDRNLRLPREVKMLSLPGRTLVYTCSTDEDRIALLNRQGAEIHRLEPQGFLAGVMQDLASLEINEVLLESGPTLAGAMMEAELVDEIILYQAPVLMGDEARGLFQLPGVKDMDSKLELALLDERMVGRDRKLTYRLKPGANPGNNPDTN